MSPQAAENLSCLIRELIRAEIHYVDNIATETRLDAEAARVSLRSALAEIPGAGFTIPATVAYDRWKPGPDGTLQKVDEVTIVDVGSPKYREGV
jgi:hypothetical protein